MNKTAMLIIKVFLCILTVLSIPVKEALAETGVWSAEATEVLSPPGSARATGYRRYIEVVAPDKKSIAIIDDFSLKVKVNGKFLRGIDGAGVEDYPSAELLWSPDSKAFALTQSHGGAIGEYDCLIYIISNDRVREINDIDKYVMKEFMKHYRCDPDEPDVPNEEPNIGAVKWLDGSKQLLLVAEVPNHSSCPQMGMIMGYIVNIPSGKIIKEMDEKEVRTKWGNILTGYFQHAP